MKRVVLDTNVSVSFLTDRNAEQQAQASALFVGAAQGGLELILHQIVVTELVYVLGNLYGRKAEEIAGLLAELLSLPGMTPVDEVVWSQVFDLWPRRIADHPGAVLAAVSRHGRFDAVATFDKSFGRSTA